MVAVQQRPPEDRYGSSADARADRRLKAIGAVLGAGLLALIGWFGFSYLSGTDVSGELIKFEVVSDESVEVHLEIRKDAEARGVCTLSAQDAEGNEVGRKDVRLDAGESRVDRLVDVRTTTRAVLAELVGCDRLEGSAAGSAQGSAQGTAYGH